MCTILRGHSRFASSWARLSPVRRWVIGPPLADTQHAMERVVRILRAVTTGHRRRSITAPVRILQRLSKHLVSGPSTTKPIYHSSILPIIFVVVRDALLLITYVDVRAGYQQMVAQTRAILGSTPSRIRPGGGCATCFPNQYIATRDPLGLRAVRRLRQNHPRHAAYPVRFPKPPDGFGLQRQLGKPENRPCRRSSTTVPMLILT